MVENIFFAYTKKNNDNVSAIREGISEYNNYQKGFKAICWEDLEVGGRIVNNLILEEIKNCSVFACDLTYLNHNVLFELGYAIGKNKKLIIFLNDKIKNSKENYYGLKSLRNIGYKTFSNSKNILSVLQKKSFIDNYFLKKDLNIDLKESNSNDLLYITSKIQNQTSLKLSELIEGLSLKIIKDDNYEVSYKTLIWYFNSIVKSSSILIHLIGADFIDDNENNAESSFYAGIGCGLGKKVILIAPKPFRAPIDYEDILIEYNDVEDCIGKVDNWIKKYINKIYKFNEQSELEINLEEQKFNLLKLGIGSEIAEDEKEQLLNYFIEIESYKKAFDKKRVIFIGRKGSGKSALFIKLEDDLSKSNHNNFNLIIKPDSEELIENIELSNLYNSEVSKKSFFKTVWKYILFSKLFLLVYERVNLKTSNIIYIPTKLEERIINLFNKKRDFLNVNFFEAVKYINLIIKGSRIVDNPEVLESFYKELLTDLTNVINEYFLNEKYFYINILADNLDKTWESKLNLDLQADMILSLLEFGDTVINDIEAIRKKLSKLSIIIFLRNDIFEYLINKSREPDKLTIYSSEIDWRKYPDLLKKLLEKRFKYILGFDDENKIVNVWNDYFFFNSKETPYDTIKKYIVERPRDFIYFITRLFESAVNNDHEKVNILDLEYAIGEYSNFLINNLISELKAEFPNIFDIIYEVKRLNKGLVIEYYVFIDICRKYYNNSQLMKLSELLFMKEYIIGLDHKGIVYKDFKVFEKNIHHKLIRNILKRYSYIEFIPGKKKLLK